MQWTGFRTGRIAGAIFLALATSLAMAAEMFGPTPYLSSADTPEGFASGATVIEDFEDAAIAPDLITSGVTLTAPGSITDSVDADDGSIDNDGRGGHSLFGASIRIGFAPPLPTSAGMVWTDGSPSDVTFEAFGADGESLGTAGPVMLGDGSISGTTGEDRFFGVREATGISAIRLSSNAVMEIDHVQINARVEPAIMSTIDDGSVGLVLPTPDGNLPDPSQHRFAMPAGVVPHGLAFLDGSRVLFADFVQPRLLLSSLTDPDAVTSIPLPGRSNGNGSLAVDPNGRYAISIGEDNAPARGGEAVVVDFGVDPPQVASIDGGLRVLGFVTAAIDFAPDRRAFVCHTGGVSVLSPPYTTIDFTMAFPPVVQSPSMCRLTRDGSRLFVTRVLSETVASLNAVRTTSAPYSADSAFVAMPAPADVQGLGPMAISPQGDALIVGQQFLFPPAFAGVRARAFLLRAPFDGSTTYQELALPSAVTGVQCTDAGNARDCPGYEHIEVSVDGSLAILTGNSGAQVAAAGDSVPAVFLRRPFDEAQRSALAVQIAPGEPTPGRGAGGVRFRPDRIFTDGVER